MCKVVVLSLVLAFVTHLIKRVLKASKFRKGLFELCQKEDRFYREMARKGQLPNRRKADESYPLEWVLMHRKRCSLWRLVGSRNTLCLYGQIPNEPVRDRLIAFYQYYQQNPAR